MTVEIQVGKSHYKIACKDEEKAKLLDLAESLNARLEDLSSSIKNADEKTLLVITALMLEEELRHKEEEFTNQEMFDSMSDNIENITSYIEKLTKKIHHS